MLLSRSRLAEPLSCSQLAKDNVKIIRENIISSYWLRRAETQEAHKLMPLSLGSNSLDIIGLDAIRKIETITSYH